MGIVRTAGVAPLLDIWQQRRFAAWFGAEILALHSMHYFVRRSATLAGAFFAKIAHAHTVVGMVHISTAFNWNMCPHGQSADTLTRSYSPCPAEGPQEKDLGPKGGISACVRMNSW